MREFHSGHAGGRWIPFLIASLFLVAGLFYPAEAFGLSKEAARALGILLFTVILWASEALPLSVTSLLAVGLLALTGTAPSFARAAQGFASDTVFFLVAATLMAQAVDNAGLIERIARLVMKWSGGNPARALWLIFGFTGMTALIMPSSLVRTKALIPVAERIHGLVGSGGRSGFLIAAGLVMALLGPVASISVMTGGGMSIVAAGTISEFYRPLAWPQWLVMMALPGVVILVLCTALIARFYLRGEAASAPASGALVEAVGVLRARERIALMVLAATLGLWLIGSRWELPLAVPAILAVAVFALPRIRLVTGESIQKQKWDEILVVGSGLSLGAVLRETGAIQPIVDGLFALFPDTVGALGIYALTAFFVFVVRMFFLQPSPCMVIMLPIVIELAHVTGVEPLFLAMLAAGVIGVAQLVPIHSPSALLCFSSGIFTSQDQLRTAPFLILISGAVFILAALLYWPVLQVWNWI